jgi:hypothetical protein
LGNDIDPIPITHAFTDSLGTLQAARNFETGRAGVKLIYPFAWTSSVALSRYLGLSADYYFSQDDAQTIGLLDLDRARPHSVLTLTASPPPRP